MRSGIHRPNPARYGVIVGPAGSWHLQYVRDPAIRTRAHAASRSYGRLGPAQVSSPRVEDGQLNPRPSWTGNDQQSHCSLLLTVMPGLLSSEWRGPALARARGALHLMTGAVAEVSLLENQLALGLVSRETSHAFWAVNPSRHTADAASQKHRFMAVDVTLHRTVPRYEDTVGFLSGDEPRSRKDTCNALYRLHRPSTRTLPARSYGHGHLAKWNAPSALSPCRVIVQSRLEATAVSLATIFHVKRALPDRRTLT